MCKQLIPAIVNWIQKSGGSQSTALIGKTFHYANNPIDTPQIPQPADIGKPVSAAHTNLTESSTVEGGAKEFTEKSTPSVWLSSNANISSDNKRIRIRIGSEKSAEVYIFSMTVLEAGYFLLAHKKALQHAYWPIKWPKWLEREEAYEVSTHDNFLH